jgi:predicted transcriptional regulator
MNYSFPDDIQSAIIECLSSGDYETEDDVLRAALAALIQQKEDLAAIEEGLEDVDAGEPGVPLEEVLRQMRSWYHMN